MEDVQTFKDQLALVNIQLESDKDNADLLALKSELEELISLTEQAAAASAPKKDKGKGREREREEKVKERAEPTANWQDSGEYRAGMDCMAKYKDGKWYPARINQVVGSQESPLYTITFKGYTASTNVPLSSLRPHDPSAPIPVPVKRAAEPTEREKEKKKRKGEKWMASQKERADEARSKQNSWEKFGKKAQKKGIHIAGLEGTSVFRTSDSPYARVGVFNSGHGMKGFDKMGKHKFDRPLDEE